MKAASLRGKRFESCSGADACNSFVLVPRSWSMCIPGLWPNSTALVRKREESEQGRWLLYIVHGCCKKGVLTSQQVYCPRPLPAVRCGVFEAGTASHRGCHIIVFIPAQVFTSRSHKRQINPVAYRPWLHDSCQDNFGGSRP